MILPNERKLIRDLRGVGGHPPHPRFFNFIFYFPYTRLDCQYQDRGGCEEALQALRFRCDCGVKYFSQRAQCLRNDAIRVTFYTDP
jgi:hypothetical protein